MKKRKEKRLEEFRTKISILILILELIKVLLEIFKSK